jgi:hypothetical protein
MQEDTLSTVTSAQHRRIIQEFNEHKELNSFQLRELGICAPATRVLELKAKGYDIRTVLIDLWRGRCFHRRVAKYVFYGKKVF